MKSAHKLALALSTFVLLSVAAYFVFTGLRGASAPRHSLPPPPAGPEQTADASRALGSTGNESAAVEPADARQTGAPGPEATSPSELATPGHASDPSTQPAGSSTPTSGTSSAASPPASSPASGQASSQASGPPQPTQDLSAASPASATSGASSPSTLTGLIVGAASSTTEPPAASPAAEANLHKATNIPPHDGPPSEGPTTSERLYKEATQRPRSQEVDLSDSERAEWEEFKRHYGRRFASQEEEQERRSNFIGNLRFINTFNQNSQAMFKLGVNHFADSTPREINELFVGPTRGFGPQQVASTASIKLMADPADPLALFSADQEERPLKSVSYRNLTGEAVDQGTCRESALYAAVGALESAINAGRSERLKLSEQQLIDCLTYNVPPPPSWPPVCLGHLSMVHVFDFLQRQAIRLSSAQEYGAFRQAQLEGRVPPNLCVLPPNSPETHFKMSSYGTVMRESLDEALAHSGPLVVALDASRPTFHFYKSGLYHEEACSTGSYNYHALLVAAAYSDGDAQMAPSSYTIRASFGPDWGERGHMHLLRDQQRNKCLPQQSAVYPNIGIE